MKSRGEAKESPVPRTWVEVNIGAIRHNVEAIRRAVGEGVEILAVVKANAYGHGAAAVAGCLAGRVGYFGVACVEEALVVEGLGPDVMLLSPCLPEERALAVRRGHIVTVSSAQEAAAFAVYGNCRVNFKIDTGMGRIGCWKEGALTELECLVRTPRVCVHSISTHLPSSDEDVAFTQAQLAGFRCDIAQYKALAPGAKIHVLNSAGIFGFPAEAGDIVRAGLAVYGVACPPDFQPLLRPALTWKARLLTVRDCAAGRSISYGRTFVTPEAMRVATVSVGYADGFPRQVSGRGARVLVRGTACSVLGRVTMDQIVADVSKVDSPTEGDEVVLLGRQGEAEIAAAELAARAGTIPWDIFTGLAGRVRRIYPGQAAGE